MLCAAYIYRAIGAGVCDFKIWAFMSSALDQGLCNITRFQILAVKLMNLDSSRKCIATSSTRLSSFPQCSQLKDNLLLHIIAMVEHIPEGDHSTKTTTSKGAAVSHSSGGKIPYAALLLPIEECTQTHIKCRYPKHVWSPAGGWYSQPANWRANTAIMFGVIFGITAMAWSVSAEREYRTRYPEPDRFFPSRW